MTDQQIESDLNFQRAMSMLGRCDVSDLIKFWRLSLPIKLNCPNIEVIKPWYSGMEDLISGQS